MREATLKCLRDAYCTESMSHVRYLIFAGQAQEESFPSISRLFRAFALAKYLRASELYVLSSDMLENPAVGADSYFIFERTVDHLTKVRDMEAYYVKEVFEPYLAIATAEGEHGAAKCLQRSVRISQTIVSLSESFLQKLQHTAEEPEIGDLFICTICGEVAPDVPPEECPCCGGSAAGFLVIV